MESRPARLKRGALGYSFQAGLSVLQRVKGRKCGGKYQQTVTPGYSLSAKIFTLGAKSMLLINKWTVGCHPHQPKAAENRQVRVTGHSYRTLQRGFVPNNSLYPTCYVGLFSTVFCWGNWCIMRVSLPTRKRVSSWALAGEILQL